MIQLLIQDHVVETFSWLAMYVRYTFHKYENVLLTSGCQYSNYISLVAISNRHTYILFIEKDRDIALY